MATILSLQDNFNDNSIDTGKWNSYTAGGGSVFEINNQIELAVDEVTSGSTAELYSASNVNFSDKYYYINFKQAAASYVDTYVGISTSGGDRAVFIYYDGSITAYTYLSAVEDYRASASVTPGSSLWLRMRTDSTTFYWDYSTNNQISWSVLDSDLISNLFSMDSVTVQLGVYKWSATSTLQVKTIFDEFNTFDLTISVNDSVGITESTTRSGLSSISTSDAVTISEFVSARITGSLVVYDQVLITENLELLQTQLYSYINVYDGVTLNENIQGQIESILTIDLSQDMNTVYVY